MWAIVFAALSVLCAGFAWICMRKAKKANAEVMKLKDEIEWAWKRYDDMMEAEYGE